MNRKWLLVILTIIILIGGSLIYLKTRSTKDFGPLIQKRLAELVHKGSNGLYTLTIDSVHLDVLKGEIVLSGITMRVDSIRLSQLDSQKLAPNDVCTFSVKTILVNGISPADLLNKKNISLNIIYIDNPEVKLFHQKKDYNTKADTGNVYERIQTMVGHFSLNDLVLENIDFSFQNRDKKNEITSFKHISLTLNNMLIDSSSQFDQSRFLYAKDAKISLHNYSFSTNDHLYTFHFDSALLHASSQDLFLSNVSFKPAGAKENFSKKLPYYKDRYDVDIDNVLFKNIDWYHLLTGEGFTATKATLTNGKIEVFADRLLAPSGKTKVGNYPHQMLMRLDLQVYIPKIETKNITVIYKERSAKSKKTGELVFKNINGEFTNVTNENEFIRKNNTMKLDAYTSFMNAAPMHAVFNFDLSKTAEGAFTVDAEIDSLDGRVLTNTTAALGLFEINSGRISKLQTHISGYNYQSTGAFTLLYDDLKITALKVTDDTAVLKKKGLITFVANNFILKKSNTVFDDNTDQKNVAFKRDPYKSFFNLIWKTMLDGIIKTVKGKN